MVSTRGRARFGVLYSGIGLRWRRTHAEWHVGICWPWRKGTRDDIVFTIDILFL